MSAVGTYAIATTSILLVYGGKKSRKHVMCEQRWRKVLYTVSTVDTHASAVAAAILMGQCNGKRKVRKLENITKHNIEYSGRIVRAC